MSLVPPSTRPAAPPWRPDDLPAEAREAAEHATPWRRHLHAHPELAFEERATARFVAERLREMGLEPVTGLARGTGVVATVRAGKGPRAVALRADLDALPIQETSGAPHASRNAGRMHACGHDGHVAMLLGAARVLAATRRFDGAVHLVFQPAEEGAGGGKVMVDEGLFERFPCEAVFGLHAWPALPLGQMAVFPGPIMASCDKLRVVVRGRPGHAAMPHQTVDPIVAASAVVLALQTVVAREVSPTDGAVISVTSVHGGEAFNAIPAEVVLGGTTRALSPAVRDLLERRVGEVARGVAAAHGATAEVTYERAFPPTVNAAREATFAADVMAELVGDGAVHRTLAPSLAAEDFAFLLEAKAGAYGWIGTGRGPGSPMLHHDAFDFADEALSLGIAYWVRLAERWLGAAG